MASPVRHFYEFGQFRLDPNKHRLLRDGQVVPLSPKAIDALLVLVQNPGKLLEREELMQAVWADTFVEDANLTVAISHLRKALGQNGETADYIETVPRVGYRFVADVREIKEKPAPLIVEKHTLSKTTIEEEFIADDKHEDPLANEALVIPVDLSRNSLRDRVPQVSALKTIVVTALLVALTAGAVVLYRHSATAAKVEGAPATIHSVAVLPLKNLTGDPNDEYLSDGLTEGLIDALSKIDGLKVISRGSVFALKGKEIDPREIGKRLGVTSVIEGSVLKGKDSARVSMRLVNTEDGRVLWAGEMAEKSLGNILAIQDDLARSVIKSLRPKFGAEETDHLARRDTDNPEAHQLYLKGRYFWNKRTGQDLITGIHYFEQAITLDPGYALAYAGLADSYAVLSYFSNRPFDETFPKAKAAAEKALEIDNGLAEPHATLGFVISTYEWNWPRADSEYKRALELNPNYATGHHWYGLYLLNMGRRDESVREVERALELDPFSIEINSDLGAVLLYAYRPDEAIKRFEMTLEMDQNFIEAHLGLGRAYQQKGELEQSIVELEKARELSQRRPDVLAALGRSYALAKERTKALDVIAQLKALPKETNISPYHFAVVYLALGEKDKALTALEAALQARSTAVYGLKSDFVVDELRGDQRFQKILAGIGLAQ